MWQPQEPLKRAVSTPRGSQVCRTAGYPAPSGVGQKRGRQGRKGRGGSVFLTNPPTRGAGARLGSLHTQGNGTEAGALSAQGPSEGTRGVGKSGADTGDERIPQRRRHRRHACLHTVWAHGTLRNACAWSDLTNASWWRAHRETNCVRVPLQLAARGGARGKEPRCAWRGEARDAGRSAPGAGKREIQT